MARPGSQQVAGYFPAPPSLLPSFASLLTWPEFEGPAVVFDPCAGEGEALAGLAEAWFGDPDERLDRTTHLVACELEALRAEALRLRLRPLYGTAHHADAFRLVEDPGSTGASALWLNPPYDVDREFGRLEHRFLVRCTRFLQPGGGVLLFLVPHGALAASAAYLAAEYRELRAYRLPEEEFHRFGQVVVVGRRALAPATSQRMELRIRTWASDPASLPVLPERCSDPLAVEPAAGRDFELSLRVAPLDLAATLDALTVWDEAPLGGIDDVADLLGAKFETAMPPKPAHIALALSSGMFNGHRLEPNDPARHPPLLAKGVFGRRRVEVSRRTDAQGKATGAIEVERPQLGVTVLRLDSYRFHELAPGTVPAGGDDPAGWNAADLIAGYDRSLARLLREQFPPIHAPGRPDHRIALPRLARTLFRVQDEAVQAALKLLARGRNPFLVAEVGTGKTTMALAIAAALSPEQHPTTVAELARLDFPTRLPVVRRTLVLCPPHLLKSWSDQAAAVVPSARVRIVRSLGDLDAEADLYILSRETAKLGAAVRGLSGTCPRCGRPIRLDPESCASRRLRCTAKPRRAVDELARLAEELALLLLPARPDDATFESLTRHRRAAQVASWEKPRPVDRERAASLQESVRRRIVARWSIARDWAEKDVLRHLLVTFSDLAQVAGTLPLARETLEALMTFPGADGGSLRPDFGYLLSDLEHRVPQLSEEGAVRTLLRRLEALHAAGTWREEPVCGEPLYTVVPQPRRVPLAQMILRRHRRKFDLVILDEAHEFNHAGSAQAKAAHRLTTLPGVPTVVLTGSLMGGYASSLFPNFWALSPAFREEFGRDEAGAFVERYGFRKIAVDFEGGEKPRTVERGATTDRDLNPRRTIGEAPGVMPTFLLRHLLPTAIVVHKADLDAELPPITETPVPVAPGGDPLDGALLAEYRRLERLLLDRIRKDRFDPERAGVLLGTLVELPSYLDRATEDLGRFELTYPPELDSEPIAVGATFPAEYRTPKERWLLATIRERLAAGEKTLVFLRHTGTPELPRRLLGLLRELTPRVAFLDAAKVPTAKREAWIDRHVVEAGVEVLLVNPNAVRTGLNNLVGFSAGIWHELDYSATTYRQAIGRLHRIGQARPVTVEVPYFAATAQQVAFELVSKKVTASLQVDGLDLQAALEAAGAGEDDATATATALSLGQAVYEELTRAGR